MQRLRLPRSPYFVGSARPASGGCADEASPEQQVRAVIESMEVAAEARDVGDLMEHISADYRDAQGQDRTRPRATYAATSSRTSRCTCSPASRVSNSPRRRGAGQVQVGMAGRGRRAGRCQPHGRPVRLRLALVREDGEWKVSYADWRRALTQVSTSVICARSSGLYSTRPPAKRSMQRLRGARHRADAPR